MQRDELYEVHEMRAIPFRAAFALSRVSRFFFSPFLSRILFFPQVDTYIQARKISYGVAQNV